uniref:Uncharacterized protein n=1 Tax=Heliothis virescens TaxID=7102 RepID=A0A2A4JXM4_HELVI
MTDEPECQLRRRKVSGNPNLPLNLDVEYLVCDGDPDQGTPSPSNVRRLSHQKQKSSSSTLLDYKNKQQSFDIQVEECEEEEIIIESEDDDDDNAEGGDDRSITPTPIQDFGANVVYTEGPQATDFLRVEECEEEEIIIESEDDDDDNAEGGDDRSITPTPIQDFGANVVYTEGPQATDFLRVKAIEAECYTDVSDADTDEEN